MRLFGREMQTRPARCGVWLGRRSKDCKIEPKMLPAEGRTNGSETNMMPLTMAKAGDTVTIQKITGKDEVRLHLAELGFVVGSQVTVVNEIAGNLIVQVKESRLALDKTMANRIMVG